MKRIPRWILFALVVGVVVRLLLPEAVKWKANRVLRSLEDYTGEIQGVHLALWRGAFELKDIKIRSRDDAMGLVVDRFGFRLVWPQLFRGAVVTDVSVQSPRFRIRVDKPAQAAQKVTEKTKKAHKEVELKTGKSLPDLLAGLIPFRIRTFHLKDGSMEIQEIAPHTVPVPGKEKPQSSPGELEARVTDLEVDVKNLTNTPKLAGTPYASGRVQARIMQKGQLKMDLMLNPTASPPVFDLNVALTDIVLKELNPLFRWQWGVDVKQGSFAMFAEATAREGRFKGYVKPFLHKVEMHDKEQDKDKGLGSKIKEAVVDAAVSIFKNDDTKNVATRIPFEGRFEDPKVGIWQAIVTVLQNAFVKALSPQLDKS